MGSDPSRSGKIRVILNTVECDRARAPSLLQSPMTQAPSPVSLPLSFPGCEHSIQIQLLPEKAVYLPASEALLVSDVHLGKSETFQHHGIPIPSRVNHDTLARLERARDRTGARRLIILGDLFHGPWALVDEVIDLWLHFLHRTGLTADLILGNHDRPLTETLNHLSLTCWTTALDLNGVTLSHEPLPQLATVNRPVSTGINICGHIHPCVRLGGRGDRLRLPCFYWEKSCHRLTLPAFGDFTGGHEVPLSADAIAYVIADNQVIAIGEL